MHLSEQGEIDIDQPLFAYLPQFHIRSRFNIVEKPITVRSLVNHHSGLPTDLVKGMWSYAPFTEVASALAEEYAAYPPGLVFSYPNVDYALLGHMIQQVSGQPFTAYMNEHLFRPIGMNHSAFTLKIVCGFAATAIPGFR
jgi:CubicO group peptidase (beta-lactamase class C family)